MPITLFNSMGRKLVDFVPLKDKEVGFYGCGPTVYNYAHIGNLRAYMTHDILVRTLRRNGYKVRYVMNITDVGHLTGDDDSGEDKMLTSAAERGKTVMEIARYYTDAFFRDIDKLNITRADIVCAATEHIGDMIALIKRLEDRGLTYSAGGNLYFDVHAFPDYGKLAGQSLEDLKAGARIAVDPNKRNPEDFALWFTNSKFENQALTWDSPWGRGYPGWHIECSAMSMKYLGESFDIHAGGIDHIPVHHTNEIAQSEGATGKQWVSYWVHNEFLVMDKGKMSKSSGDFITLQRLIDEGWQALDYRYFLLGGHYRSQLQFSFEALDTAKHSRKSLLDRIRQVRGQAQNELATFNAAQLSPEGRAHIEAFDRALKQDLSTPRALAELWQALRNPKLSPQEAVYIAFNMDEVLGLRLEENSRAQELSAQERQRIQLLVDERNQAKKTRDFARADAIRNELASENIILKDGPDGTSWEIKQG